MSGKLKPYPPCPRGCHRWLGYDEIELSRFVYCRCGARGKILDDGSIEEAMTKPKDCPYCGSKAKHKKFEKRSHTVFCKSCQMYGPTHVDEVTAVQSWNRIIMSSVGNPMTYPGENTDAGGAALTPEHIMSAKLDRMPKDKKPAKFIQISEGSADSLSALDEDGDVWFTVLGGWRKCNMARLDSEELK